MKQVLKIFLLSKIIFLILVIITSVLTSLPSEEMYKGEAGWVNPFTAYDSQNYLWIAQHGYSIDALCTFFPLYPILIKGFSLFGMSYPVAGVLISWIASFGAAYLFYQLADQSHKKTVVWLWCMSPIAIFTWSVYTESLFVFLSLLSYFLFRKKQYLWTGIFIGLSMLTRNTGYFLVPFFFILMYLQKEHLKNYFKMFISAGIIGGLYPIYLWVSKGNPFYFAKMQSDFFKVSGYPWDTIWRDIQILGNQGKYSIIIVINFIAIILALYLAVKYRKKHWGYSIFLLLGTIIPLFAPTIPTDSSLKESVPATISEIRYVFGLFPIYLLLAHDWTGRKRKIIYLSVGLFIYFLMTVLFITKMFVA